jgi:hypothetical protein
MGATDAVRALTDGERRLADTIFRGAVDFSQVTVKRKKWFPFQPRTILMAPTGHLHAHPKGGLWSADYAQERLGLQALFLHELTHVWQAQRRGRFYLPLMRHPLCRYDYAVRPGLKFERYGLEQQAEIVRHVHLLRHAHAFPGAPALAQLESILPF